MVSLLKLAEITEEGVKFRSPHDDSEMLLTPEHSMEIQNTIGADIMMQLDDVVHVKTTGARVEEAMERSVRWLDRCIQAHKRAGSQNLFGIIQGGLDTELRRKCIEAMVERDLPGYAVGGLSGGEEKDVFWRIVTLCTDLLPRHKPRYLMGVGFPVDLVVCCALGIDMYDCVYPTRTARFGVALVPWGQVNLKSQESAADFSPIDRHCSCPTCQQHSRAYLHPLIMQKETVACNLITLHNLHYMLTLMRDLRQSIAEQRFPQFVQAFMEKQFPSGCYEPWIVNALASVNVKLKPPSQTD